MDTNEYLTTKYGSGFPKVIPGIFRKDLYKIFAELGLKTGCEVGVFRGRNAREMFRRIPDLKLFGVDPFIDAPTSSRHHKIPRFERNERNTMERMAGRDFTLKKGFSEVVVQEFPYSSLDFVYIDGDHSYDYVMTDIILWARRVRPGGIVSGHDYLLPKKYDGRLDLNVKQAVDDYLKIHRINNFYITDNSNATNASDVCASWFFVKS
jgi:SAM-dependent methyltransferase